MEALNVIGDIWIPEPTESSHSIELSALLRIYCSFRLSPHRDTIHKFSMSTAASLPPWDEESRKFIIHQLYDEVGQFSTKTAIAPPIVPYKRLTNDSSFLYQKLDESQSEIRLLDLALTKDNSPIYCNLASISINCNPQYAALSYEWGNAT